MLIQIVASLPRLQPIFAAITSIGEFKDLLGTGLGLAVVTSFVFGVFAFIAGVLTRERNPESSKWAFVTSILLALAVPAVSLLFAAAGQAGAVVEPRF